MNEFVYGAGGDGMSGPVPLEHWKVSEIGWDPEAMARGPRDPAGGYSRWSAGLRQNGALAPFQADTRSFPLAGCCTHQRWRPGGAEGEAHSLSGV